MLQVTFIMICIFHKILELLKITTILRWTPSLEEEYIIKDVRNLFRLEKLKKETTKTTIKGKRDIFRLKKENEETKDSILRDIRNLFRLEKENKAIKDIILTDIRNLFENEEEENYYKPVRANCFRNNNYTEYESSDINKTLSVEEYLNRIRPCLKDIINNFKKSDTWKIQLTIVNNLISSLDNDEERVKHSKSDNIETMINDEADKFFDSLKNRYRNKLESMKGSDFLSILFIYCIIK